MKCFKMTNSPNQVVFKRWGRKSYSLFSVIKYAVHVAVLPVIYFLSTPVVTVAAEPDTVGVRMELDLEEIEVSAQRAPSLYPQVARVLNIIDASQIEAAPVQSIQELLEYVAGVDIRQRGPGSQADISIRGGTFDQTLILLNGINITDPQTGHHNLNLPVTLQQIERIEILEGPAARVYGPNAFSGAINIVTKSPGGNKVNLQATAGSFGYIDAGVSGGFGVRKLTHLVSGGIKKTDGYINNTDFSLRNIYYASQWKAESGKLLFQAGYTDKGFGANSFYTPRFPNQYENTSTLLGSVKWESTGIIHLTPVLYWRKHSDEFMLFRNESPEWYKSHNYHQTQTWGAGVNSWMNWQGGKTSFGAEVRSEEILSNVLGTALYKPIKVPGKDAFFTLTAQREIISVFLEHAIYTDRWTLSGGIMSNNISGTSRNWNFFPGVEASYRLGKGTKVFGSWNTSLRMPTFTDLYYAGPTNIGNPDLAPETAYTAEGGLKINRDLIKGHLVLFYRNGSNIIDWTKKQAEDLWQPRNLTGIESFGTEIYVQMDLSELNYAPENISLSWFSNNLKKENEEFISNYVLDNLRYKFVASAEQKLLKNVFCSVKLIWQDREGTFTRFENNSWGEETAYDPFWLVDGKINWNYRNLKLFISAENILDVTYHDIGNVVQPGRWFKTGLSFNFDFN